MTSINSDDVRLFVACEVPDEVKNSIGGLIESLKSRSANDVRWIKSEGVHVTLKFLGEVPVKKPLRDQDRDAGGGRPPLPLPA